MQFSDPTFLFVFLPVTLLAFYAVGWRSRVGAAVVLIVASLAFYLPAGRTAFAILGASVVVNYALALILLRERSPRFKRGVVAFGVCANVALLAYFKYRGFFLENVASLTGAVNGAARLFIPLGISFYTFQKIAFIVDVYRGKVERFGLVDYLLYSTFFPCLLSGPITRPNEMFPQFGALSARFDAQGFTEGLSIFIVGLAKKVLVADAIAGIAATSFNSYGAGKGYGMAGAWVGVLAFSMQLYYDFSGYSEMALGLAKMANLRLPVNFNAPYKANSIIGFWARWHISLSRWLRDYVFMSIGNLYSTSRRLMGVMATMLICGLWHGAAWTFVIWGGLHGIYLIVNHAWRGYAERHPDRTAFWTAKRMKPLGLAITFIAVCLSWVFFRAADVPSAFRMLAAMFGLNGVAPLKGFVALDGAIVALLTLFTLKAPHALAIFSKARPCLENMPVIRTRLRWKPGFWPAVAIGVLVFLIFRSQMAATESVRFTYSAF